MTKVVQMVDAELLVKTIILQYRIIVSVVLNYVAGVHLAFDRGSLEYSALVGKVGNIAI